MIIFSICIILLKLSKFSWKPYLSYEMAERFSISTKVFITVIIRICPDGLFKTRCYRGKLVRELGLFENWSSLEGGSFGKDNIFNKQYDFWPKQCIIQLLFSFQYQCALILQCFLAFFAILQYLPSDNKREGTYWKGMLFREGGLIEISKYYI